VDISTVTERPVPSTNRSISPARTPFTVPKLDFGIPRDR
jgi:hypothetical protein